MTLFHYAQAFTLTLLDNAENLALYMESHAKVPISVSAYLAHMVVMCMREMSASLCLPQACCSVGQSSLSATRTQKGLVVVASHLRHDFSKSFLTAHAHATVLSAKKYWPSGIFGTAALNVDKCNNAQDTIHILLNQAVQSWIAVDCCSKYLMQKHQDVCFVL